MYTGQVICYAFDVLSWLCPCFADRCTLEQPDAVSALQERFLECLRYQIAKAHRNPNTRLRMLIDRLLGLRDITDLNSRANKKFLKDWQFVIQDYPLWKELLSFDEI